MRQVLLPSISLHSVGTTSFSSESSQDKQYLAGLEDLSLLYVLLDHQNQGDHLCLDHQEHQLDLEQANVKVKEISLQKSLNYVGLM